MVWIFIFFITEEDPISEFHHFRRARFACQGSRSNLGQAPFLSLPYALSRDIVRVHFSTIK